MGDMEVRDWREAPMIQQLSYMLHHNIRTDCSFVVGNQVCNLIWGGILHTFRCHKLLMSRASAVLDAMLYHPTAPTDDIIVKDVLPETFQTFLEYIYTDEIKLQNITHAMALCELADVHGMLRLQIICANYICANLQPNIFWTVLEFAIFLEKPSNFKEKCLEYLRANTLACLEEENFVHTSQAAVSLLLEQECMNINSELDLIHATGRWAAQEAARLYGSQFSLSTCMLRKVLGPLFSKLRFLSLKPCEFDESFLNYELLSEDEKYTVIVNLLTFPGQIPLADSICRNRKPRNVQ